MQSARSQAFYAAKNSKNDEFYTQIADIEQEAAYYKDQFAGKTVYMNCDDPRYSNFFIIRYLSRPCEKGWWNRIAFDQRRHHEIYLSGPRKADPAKMRTVVRHPIRTA